MSTRLPLAAVVLFVILLPAAAAQGQTDSSANLTCTPLGSAIDVEVDIVIGDLIPDDWVGWVVKRQTLSWCEPDRLLGSIDDPFHFYSQVRHFVDEDVELPFLYYYCIYAVDQQGELHRLGGPPLFPPGYYHDDFCAPGGAGLLGEGRLVSDAHGGGYPGFDVCDDGCWYGTGFISELPGMLWLYLDTDTYLMLFGTIDNEFEGAYISSITEWYIIDACGPVPARKESWSGLKALYR